MDFELVFFFQKWPQNPKTCLLSTNDFRHSAFLQATAQGLPDKQLDRSKIYVETISKLRILITHALYALK